MKKELAIPVFVGKRVCIIGNLNVDLIIRNVPQMPQWGQEVFGDNYLAASSGQSAYTAFALGKYNIHTGIISNVGNDLYGDKILKDLGSAGIDISEVEKVADGKTGITVAIVRCDGERAFVSDPSSLASFNRETVKRHQHMAESADLVCIVGNFFLPGFSIEDVGFFSKKLRKSGTPVLLDTGWDPGNWPRKTIGQLRGILKHVDYFIPNIDEAAAITGERGQEKAAEKLLSDGCGNVIIKLGADGCYLRSENDEIYVPPFKTTIVDAVGAGDVFNAGFIFGVLQNWPMEAAMIFGSATASLYISRLTNRFPEFRETAELANTNANYQFMEDDRL